MTTRATQESLAIGVKEVPSPTEMTQFALLVAVTLQPDTSPTEVSQFSLLVAVRRQGRRSITTSG